MGGKWKENVRRGVSVQYMYGSLRLSSVQNIKKNTYTLKTNGVRGVIPPGRGRGGNEGWREARREREREGRREKERGREMEG